MATQPLHRQIWELWSRTDQAAHTAGNTHWHLRSRLERQEPGIGPQQHIQELLDEAAELAAGCPEVAATMRDIINDGPNDTTRLARIAGEASRLTQAADALWSAVQASLGKPPVVEVVPLRNAAEVLGVEDVRAAESALRRAEVRSGYPLAQVRWLRDNRPGRGARTDLHQAQDVLRSLQGVTSISR